MVDGEITRGPSAHTAGTIENGAPDGEITRRKPGGVDGRIAIDEVGE